VKKFAQSQVLLKIAFIVKKLGAEMTRKLSIYRCVMGQ